MLGPSVLERTSHLRSRGRQERTDARSYRQNCFVRATNKSIHEQIYGQITGSRFESLHPGSSG